MIDTQVCDPFAEDCMRAVLSAGYRVALIRPNAARNYGRQSASYAELGTDEVTGTGYIKGGAELRNARVEVRDGLACLNFDDVRWPNADIVADGALIYRADGRAACVLSFKATHAAVGGETFVLPIDCPIRL